MENAATEHPQDGLPLILLVEDNPDDVLLVRRALKKAALAAGMTVVGDGDAAVDWLQQALADTAHTPLPALVLLDLKLPKRSGIEVLRWLRTQPQLAATPVVMLTSSREDEDIQRAYAAGANSYLQKPVAFNSLVQLLGILGLYWLQTNVTGSGVRAGAGASIPNEGSIT